VRVCVLAVSRFLGFRVAGFETYAYRTLVTHMYSTRLSGFRLVLYLTSPKWAAESRRYDTVHAKLKELTQNLMPMYGHLD
jgi:hypothetical protein